MLKASSRCCWCWWRCLWFSPSSLVCSGIILSNPSLLFHDPDTTTFTFFKKTNLRRRRCTQNTQVESRTIQNVKLSKIFFFFYFRNIQSKLFFFTTVQEVKKTTTTLILSLSPSYGLFCYCCWWKLAAWRKKNVRFRFFLFEKEEKSRHGRRAKVMKEERERA